MVVGLAGLCGAVGVGDVEVGVGEEFEVQVVSVDVVVVAVAEHHQVVEFCGAVVLPVVDVVGVAPGDWAVAAWVSAAAVAGGDGTEQICWHGAC